MTLAEAVELKPFYSSSTLLALRDESPRLIQEGITRVKGRGESALYCIYVEEWPGLFAGDTPHVPNEEGTRTLRAALQATRERTSRLFRSGRSRTTPPKPSLTQLRCSTSTPLLSALLGVRRFITCCAATCLKG